MIVVNSGAVGIKRIPTVVGLPSGVYVEYFGHMADGTEYVIFRPENDWKYDDFACLMGKDKLESVQIKKVTRYRDGGTTDIDTARGHFHFPTPFKPELKATFNGQEITVHERQ